LVFSAKTRVTFGAACESDRFRNFGAPGMSLILNVLPVQKIAGPAQQNHTAGITDRHSIPEFLIA